MKVRIKKIDNTIEKQILTGMIISDEFLPQIKEIWKDDLIKIPYVRTVGNWCMKFHAKYNKAPGKNIKKIYQKESFSNQLEDEQASLFEKFLIELSEDFERQDKFNFQYVLDNAVERFKEQGLLNLSDEIKSLIKLRKVNEAEIKTKEFHSVQLINEKGINPFTDKEAIKTAFSEKREPLFKFNGELGNMLNYELVRDSLIVFQGPEKRGKTWWLLQMAMKATLARCNVVFISAGDMSQNQLLRRKHIWLAKKSDRKKFCGEIKVPFGIRKVRGKGNMGDKYKGYSLEYTTINNISPLNAKQAIINGEKFSRRLVGRDFKMFCFPTNSISMSDVDNLLYKLELMENFIPDVVIIDYADILAPINAKMEFRHQTNETWAALRRLSQQRHCLVMTATQANKQSYTTETQGMENVGEDKRKLAHVNGMIGLNQNKEDKQLGLMRLNWIVLREDEFHSDNSIYVTQCLKIGRPCIGSFKDVFKDKEKVEEA